MAQNLTGDQIKQLENAGTLVQGVSGLPYTLTVVQAAKTMLDTFNDTAINATLGPYLSLSTVNPKALLQRLIDVIPSLPHGAHQTGHVIATVTVFVVTFITVVLRLYVREYRKPKKLYLEDWMCVAAMVSYYLFNTY